MQNDPRFSKYLRNTHGVQRFIALGVYTLLKDRGLLDAMAAALQSPAPFDRVVAGRPMIHWMGKGAEQMAAEGLDEAQIAAVMAALSGKGEEPAVEQDTMSFTGGTEGLPGGKPEEPAFGTPPRPLSELAGLHDGELLAIPGISKATIKRIREEAKRTKL